MISSIRPFLAALLLLLMVPAAAFADDWLVELYRKALQHDPSLGIAGARLDTARQDELIARSNLLPKVDGSAGTSYISSSTYGYIPGVLQGEFMGYNYSVMMRQPIYNGPAWSSFVAAGEGIRSADATVSMARQDLMLKVGEQALTLMKARVTVGYYESEQRWGQELLDYSEASLNEGTEDIVSRNEARARNDEAKALLVKANNMRRLAESELSSSVGAKFALLHIPAALPAQAPAGGVAVSTDTWMKAAEDRHPVLVRARADLAAAELEIETAKKGHLPTLDLSAGYTVSKGSTFLPNVETRQWVAGINLNVPLFAGLGLSAKTDRALAVRNEKSQMLEAARDDLRLKIDNAYLQLENGVAVIDAIGRRLGSEKELLSSVEQKLALGLVAVPDRINAQRRLASARRDLDTNILDAWIAWLHLKAASGQLSEADLLELGR
jgi:outer membrane protein